MAGNPQTRPGQLAHIPPRCTSSHWAGQRVGALGHLGKVDFGDLDVTPAGPATRGDGFCIHHRLSDMCDGDEHQNHTQLSVSPTPPHRLRGRDSQIDTKRSCIISVALPSPPLMLLVNLSRNLLSSQKPISWKRA